MTLLVVGISHRTAPVTLLDRVALVDGAAERLQVDLLASTHVAESLVLSTCNRVEIYAEVSKFHGGVLDVTETLAKATGIDREELTPHLYVRYEDRAVQHLFEVAAGLDSMVVGEQQILGQVRGALRTGQDLETIGRNLNDLAQAALRVGKRVHHDTGIDRAGASVVSVALHLAGASLGGSLAGKRALVVGAGAMSGLAAATLARAGIGEIVVANRTFERGQHLADQVGGRAVSFDDVAATIADVDIVFSCTGSTGLVLTTSDVETARAGVTAPLAVVDLALPHDTEETIASLPGVSRIDLASLVDVPEANAPERDVELARAIVVDEVRAHLATIAAQRVEPIVVSLRSHADQVVEAELDRLRLRLPGLGEAELDEVARAMRRSVSTLLHRPTVRMKELAADPDGARYATTLHRLFDLDPEAIAAVTAADSAEPTTPSFASEAGAGIDDLLGGTP
ncbi:glutamyl-tRNA reductase [Longivirga aurantiaca]|uniref:Glutamyl-tRNA reductase n=1 Tax=Longivirga aurantiaca TaxID=1837743 RepID=A0ABW1SZV9_9ACTN